MPFFARFLFLFYCFGIGFLLLGRFITYVYLSDGSYPLWDTLSLKSFLVGWQFDTVVLSYVLSLPLVLLYMGTWLRNLSSLVYTFVSVYLSIVSCLILVIVVADMPYFRFFHMRLSEAAFQWLNDWTTVFKMIGDNALYRSLLIALLILMPLTILLVYRYSMRFFKQAAGRIHRRHQDLIYFLLLSCACFLGLRGKIAHPIRMGDAAYCHSNLLNQMGLNPVFCLAKSYTEKVSLMPEEEAIALTKQYLQISNPDTLISPFARRIETDAPVKKYNVVLILMESMSAHYMQYFGNTRGLTPNLDSLTTKSMFFRNAYSAGIHTNNGIFSSLYAFPALKAIRPMNTMPIRKYTGLPYVTKQYGYQNIFFCAHSFEFDNIVNFIPENSFDRIVSSDMFPPEASISGFGVPDGYLFDEALRFLDSAHSSKPFFATILTASNHEPYALPDSYEKKFAEPNLNTTAYADACIGKFLREAGKRVWFDSTIFILVADHGFRVGQNVYPLELSYQHIPVIFYAPKIIAPTVMDNLMGQIDIFPTLMGMLHMSYINNTLGADIVKTPRSCIYFSADDKIGCIDQEWLYVYPFNGQESLYRYRTNDTRNFSSEKKDVLEKLRSYAFAQIQSAEWVYRFDKAKIGR